VQAEKAAKNPKKMANMEKEDMGPTQKGEDAIGNSGTPGVKGEDRLGDDIGRNIRNKPVN